MFTHPFAAFSAAENAAMVTKMRSIADGHVNLFLSAERESAEAGALVKPNTLSLVEKDGQVFFVWWDSAAETPIKDTWLGWRVRLDRMNRVVYTMPYKKSRELFAAATVHSILPGVLMLKDKGFGRMTVPSWALAKQIKLEAQIYQGPLDANRPRREGVPGLTNSCIACHSAETMGHDRFDGDSKSFEMKEFVCKLCCSIWHGGCAELPWVSPETDRYEFDADDFVCQLC